MHFGEVDVLSLARRVHPKSRIERGLYGGRLGGHPRSILRGLEGASLGASGRGVRLRRCVKVDLLRPLLAVEGPVALVPSLLLVPRRRLEDDLVFPGRVRVARCPRDSARAC
ncbi:MAG: hypothetical protein D6729_12810 [Deltaproteobacteria bacterium]|nr:MAG: hypothetical protein D6729_12810 [Deltaproteobacteria bacterium]